jgi:hypothetical protein
MEGWRRVPGRLILYINPTTSLPEMSVPLFWPLGTVLGSLISCSQRFHFSTQSNLRRTCWVYLRMAPSHRDFRNTSGGSGVCPGCSTPVEISLRDNFTPVIIAAIAIASLNILALLALFWLSFKTNKVSQLNKSKGTRYGLPWAILTFLLYVLRCPL